MAHSSSSMRASSASFWRQSWLSRAAWRVGSPAIAWWHWAVSIVLAITFIGCSIWGAAMVYRLIVSEMIGVSAISVGELPSSLSIFMAAETLIYWVRSNAGSWGVLGAAEDEALEAHEMALILMGLGYCACQLSHLPKSLSFSRSDFCCQILTQRSFLKAKSS